MKSIERIKAENNDQTAVQPASEPVDQWNHGGPAVNEQGQLRGLLRRLLETAEDYAASTCSERCVHAMRESTDCPQNNPLFVEVRVVLKLPRNRRRRC